MPAHTAKQFMDIGPAEISYNAAVIGQTVANPDGGTHGGTQIVLNTETRPVQRDAKGTQPHDVIIVGRMLEINANFTGLSIDQMQALIPGATLSAGPAQKQLVLGNPVGTSARANAKALLVKPIIEGVVSTDETNWISVPLAYAVPNFDFPFDLETQKVFAVKFICLDHATTGTVGTIGDDAAA